MTEDEPPEYESVYIAGSIRGAEAIEALLTEEQIEYELQPASFYHTISFNGPFAGVSFCVLPGQAFYCRKLFARRGFTKGIVAAEHA